MSEAAIRCQWCGLEQYAHNTDYTCGINTKAWGHKWLAGPYEIDKSEQIKELAAERDRYRMALENIMKHCDPAGLNGSAQIAREALLKHESEPSVPVKDEGKL